jgi:hypothetical protein
MEEKSVTRLMSGARIIHAFFPAIRAAVDRRNTSQRTARVTNQG